MPHDVIQFLDPGFLPGVLLEIMANTVAQNVLNHDQPYTYVAGALSHE